MSTNRAPEAADAAPALDGIAVTAADSDLPRGPCRALWVGGAGNVAVLFRDGDAAVTIVGVAAGTLLPFSVRRVNSTNTTASSIVALY